MTKGKETNHSKRVALGKIVISVDKKWKEHVMYNEVSQGTGKEGFGLVRNFIKMITRNNTHIS